MTIKSQLENIRRIQRNIYKLERNLAALNAKSLVSSPQTDGASHGRGTADTVARRGDKVIALENEIAAEKAHLQELLDYIENIPDTVLHDVVRDRCVYGFGWREIAALVGGRNTEDSVKKIYQRFMRGIENCPETGWQNY